MRSFARVAWPIVCFTALFTFAGCQKAGYEGPTYNGRSFNQWYLRWANATETGDKSAETEARDAIKQTGISALPFLIEELRAEVEKGKEPQLPPAVIFRILGPTAAPAIGELEAMMRQTNIAALSHPASCLVDIGDEALPSIARLLTNPNPKTRYHTAYAFAGTLIQQNTFTRGTNLLQVVPPLAQCSTDTDPYTAIAAVRALGAIKMDPGITVPALRNALQSPNKEVRDEAASALVQVLR